LFDSVRQIKLAIRQLLGARKYSVCYCVVLYCVVLTTTMMIIINVVFRIRHYWEIRKVVNGHKSAAYTDSPYEGTGKTCLGGRSCTVSVLL